MRKFLIAGAIAAAATTAPAHALSINFQNGGNTLLSQEILIETFDAPGAGRTPLAGTNAFIYSGNVSGEANIGPVASQTPGTAGFASLLGAAAGGASYTYTLAQPAQVFSFLLGTLDAYNSVTLNFASGPSLTLTGLQIVGAAPGSGLDSGGASGRVRYDLGGAPSLTSITFQSTGNSFEFDDFAYAVPEPATWAMMIFGFGIAGSTLRRRQRAGKLAVA